MRLRLSGVLVAIILALGVSSVTTAQENVLAMKKAAELGNVHAQTILSILYEQGEGVEQDYVKAHEWMQRAALQGYPDAQSYLGENYEQGKGVAQDYSKAREWYEIACDNGNKQGCMNYLILNEQVF